MGEIRKIRPAEWDSCVITGITEVKLTRADGRIETTYWGVTEPNGHLVALSREAYATALVWGDR